MHMSGKMSWAIAVVTLIAIVGCTTITGSNAWSQTASVPSSNNVELAPAASSTMNGNSQGFSPQSQQRTNNSAQRISLLENPPASVGVYGRYEIKFNVATNSAYPFFQYDENPPAGVAPKIGVSAEGIITTPSGKQLRQPAFYTTQATQMGAGSGMYFEETNLKYWVLRFSPQEQGTYQVALAVQDASGKDQISIGSFSATAPVSKGFIGVSKNDTRYFEYSNGELYWPTGPAWNIENDYSRYKNTGQNFERPWMGGVGAYSTNWARWISSDEELGNEGVMTNLTYKEHAPGHELSYELYYPEGFRFWMTTWGNEALGPRFKANTTYRVKLTYKTADITGPRVAGQPYGLVARTHAFLSHKTSITETETALRNKPIIFNHISSNNDWSTITADFRTGNNVENNISLYLDNVASGEAFIDEFSIKEVLTDGNLGGEVIRNPIADQHTYVDPRGAAFIDWQVEQGEQYGVFFKFVVHDKNDWIQNHLASNGEWSDKGDGYYQDENTKARWLLRQWYRYIIARWGYSTAIHSWELNNEGAPDEDPPQSGTSAHWKTAEAFARYMHQTNIHPQMATTSFWCCWRPTFWGNRIGAFPDIDYADIHEYTGHPDALPQGYSYDMALWTSETSRLLAADNVGKPIMRGETGITKPGGWDPVPELSKDNPGIWYHNLLWGQLNAGGMSDPNYWYSDHIKHINKEAISKPFSAFMQTLDINQGGYVDVNATVSSPDIRTLGQKNLASGKAYIWIQNKNHTWKNVMDRANIPPQNGTVSLTLKPSTGYTVQWINTYTGETTNSQTLSSDGAGTLTLSVGNLSDDVLAAITAGN
jgi:hypothetical protein